MSSSASIFTKIIRGELPAARVYEDQWVIAFLTLDAIQLGHTLIVPKLEIDHFSDVPKEYYQRVHALAQPLAKAIQEATGCVRVGTAVIGLEVPHFHLHLIPLRNALDMDFRRAQRFSADENRAMQQKISENLKNHLASFALN